MTFRVRAYGFILRLGWAIALTLFVFDLWVFPLGLDLKLWTPILSALNAPVSALSLFLPCLERPLDFPFGDCRHWGYQSGAETFARHVRFSVPVYVLFFYLPNILGASWSAWRRLRERQASSEPSAPGRT